MSQINNDAFVTLVTCIGNVLQKGDYTLLPIKYYIIFKCCGVPSHQQFSQHPWSSESIEACQWMSHLELRFTRTAKEEDLVWFFFIDIIPQELHRCSSTWGQ